MLKALEIISAVVCFYESPNPSGSCAAAAVNAKMSALSFTLTKPLESSYDDLNGSQEIYESSTADHPMTASVVGHNKQSSESIYPASSVVDRRRTVHESPNPSGSPYYSSLKHADGSPYEFKVIYLLNYQIILQKTGSFIIHC